MKCKLSAVISLQTWWRRISTTSKIASLRLIDSRDSFATFADWLMHKDVVKKCGDFLGAYGFNPKHARQFLSAFMIYNWGDDVTGVLEADRDKELQPDEELAWAMRDSASELVRFYTTLTVPLQGSPRCYRGAGTATDGDWDSKKEDKQDRLGTRCELTCRYAKFSRLFEKWKKMDRESIIDHMCYNYSELGNCKNMILSSEGKDSEGNKQILDFIATQQAKIKRHIEQLAGKDQFEEVMKRYRPVKLSCSYEQMREVMQKAFWDKVEADLKLTPPDYKHTLVLFGEIKAMICGLIPNRKDLHDEIHETVDTDLIRQMIENKVFDHTALESTLTYLIRFIRTLQPPVEDSDTDEWLNRTQDQCTDRCDWCIIIPGFFRKAYRKIQSIQDGLESLKKTKR